MKTENITLFFRQEKSDKVYKATLAQKDDLYIVNFAYGRRGSTLKTGTKTQTPVPYEKAKKIYDKLVKSKSAKGYVPNEDNSQYTYSSDQVKTGIHCQLLNNIEEEGLAKFLQDEDWWAQEKKDGKRLLIHKTKELTAINRKGLSVGAPDSILQAADAVDRSFLIDGEAIGDILFVFDLLALDGEDIREKPYAERQQLLQSLGFKDAIQLVNSAKTTTEKEQLYTHLKSTGAEGIVFKNSSAAYTAGRPNSGGTQRKFKFYDTASVIVAAVNNKRSVKMMVYEGTQEVEIGNVTISVNKEIPPEGSIIEVRYLYAYKGGSLYQPTFLEIRTDIDKGDCVIGQLKYKQGKLSKS